ncbi:hypothetical protein CBR_g4836, partial [Chara braunii]
EAKRRALESKHRIRVPAPAMADWKPSFFLDKEMELCYGQNRRAERGETGESGAVARSQMIEDHKKGKKVTAVGVPQARGDIQQLRGGHSLSHSHGWPGARQAAVWIESRPTAPGDVSSKTPKDPDPLAEKLPLMPSKRGAANQSKDQLGEDRHEDEATLFQRWMNGGITAEQMDSLSTEGRRQKLVAIGEMLQRMATAGESGNGNVPGTSTGAIATCSGSVPVTAVRANGDHTPVENPRKVVASAQSVRERETQNAAKYHQRREGLPPVHYQAAGQSSQHYARREGWIKMSLAGVRGGGGGGGSVKGTRSNGVLSARSTTETERTVRDAGEAARANQSHVNRAGSTAQGGVRGKEARVASVRNQSRSVRDRQSDTREAQAPIQLKGIHVSKRQGQTQGEEGQIKGKMQGDVKGQMEGQVEGHSIQPPASETWDIGTVAWDCVDTGREERQHVESEISGQRMNTIRSGEDVPERQKRGWSTVTADLESTPAGGSNVPVHHTSQSQEREDDGTLPPQPDPRSTKGEKMAVTFNPSVPQDLRKCLDQQQELREDLLEFKQQTTAILSSLQSNIEKLLQIRTAGTVTEVQSGHADCSHSPSAGASPSPRLSSPDCGELEDEMEVPSYAGFRSSAGASPQVEDWLEGYREKFPLERIRTTKGTIAPQATSLKATMSSTETQCPQRQQQLSSVSCHPSQSSNNFNEDARPLMATAFPSSFPQAHHSCSHINNIGDSCSDGHRHLHANLPSHLSHPGSSLRPVASRISGHAPASSDPGPGSDPGAGPNGIPPRHSGTCRHHRHPLSRAIRCSHNDNQMVTTPPKYLNPDLSTGGLTGSGDKLAFFSRVENEPSALRTAQQQHSSSAAVATHPHTATLRPLRVRRQESDFQYSNGVERPSVPEETEKAGRSLGRGETGQGGADPHHLDKSNHSSRSTGSLGRHVSAGWGPVGNDGHGGGAAVHSNGQVVVERTTRGCRCPNYLRPNAGGGGRVHLHSVEAAVRIGGGKHGEGGDRESACVGEFGRPKSTSRDYYPAVVDNRDRVAPSGSKGRTDGGRLLVSAPAGVARDETLSVVPLRRVDPRLPMGEHEREGYMIPPSSKGTAPLAVNRITRGPGGLPHHHHHHHHHYPGRTPVDLSGDWQGQAASRQPCGGGPSMPADQQRVKVMPCPSHPLFRKETGQGGEHGKTLF